MNRLPLAKRTQILAMLCEGASMLSVSRVADVSINTVWKLLLEGGEACLEIHDETVTDVKASRIDCNGIWSFPRPMETDVVCLEAASEGAGDVWTWAAIDPDTKLIVSYFVGNRSAQSAVALIDDLRSRLANTAQLTADGHKLDLEAADGALPGNVNTSQLISIYGGTIIGPRGYSPAEGTSIKAAAIGHGPNEAQAPKGYVERQNRTTRMSMPRSTRLTSASSKKLDNHLSALALYFAFHNFCHIQKTLKLTPAMAACITDTPWSLEDIVARIDTMAAARKPDGSQGRRGASRG